MEDRVSWIFQRFQVGFHGQILGISVQLSRFLGQIQGYYSGDFKDFSNFTPGLRYFRSGFKDYLNLQKYGDFRDFRPDFRDYR